MKYLYIVNETFHDTSRLHLNFITEDCYSLLVSLLKFETFKF